jgi:DNA polymerase-3 subunit alpha
LQDESRIRLGSDQFYFKDADKMRQLFSDHPEACDRTLEIAERCNVKFKLKDDKGKAIYHLPTYPTDEGRSLVEEIQRVAEEGLDVRFQEAEKRGEAVAEENKPQYYDRLKFELSVIDRMGFNGYFLIVQDFINWAKVHDIPVGPGRGSGAGSLVAYSLRITDLDPIPHKLIFERFLNPERISMPDFDIDFCQDRRQEVIHYVTEKYGSASVSQIITYGKLQARAAIKDVGRVLGMLYADVDAVSKLMPDKLGIHLKEALEMEPRFQEMMDLNPQVDTLMELAQKVEGLVRHAGIHAAGVIIADGSLVHHAPLYRGTEGENVVQYDMKHAEKIGLIKFDFLGLKTLTHIFEALKLVEKNRGLKIKTTEIALSDPGIYEIMCKGDTAGIFQFEGEGITDAIKKIKPNCFADITAINALYRPGPMAMIPEFAARKSGENAVEYLFPALEDALKETYGIIVYQEQVQLIAARIAGYSLGEADMLRRAMGKKNKEEMDAQRIRFLKGASENGFDSEKSNELFDLMYKFADYGFNKSHAAAYCVIAAQTAWLKNYYPSEFFAALLSTEMNDTDKVVKYSKDAQKRGIKVFSPNVNFSDFKFTVKGSDIYFGLGAIKGVGQNAVDAIIEAREKLPSKKFETLEEFFETVDIKKLNKKVIESLIKAGAFDGFSFHRSQLMNGYSKFLDRAGEARKDREMGQFSLFDMDEAGTENKVIIDEVKAWSRSQALAEEKDVLGFYLSDHPLTGFEHLIKIWTTCSVGELPQQNPFIVPPSESGSAPSKEKMKFNYKNRDINKKRVVVAGLVSALREMITKKGTRMAFSKFEDLSGSCELVVFPDSYARLESILKDEKLILVSGFLEIEEGLAKVMVDSASSFEDSLKKTKQLILKLDRLQTDEFVKLQGLIKEYPGQTGVKLRVALPELERVVDLDTHEFEGVAITNDFFENLYTQFGRSDFIEITN